MGTLTLLLMRILRCNLLGSEAVLEPQHWGAFDLVFVSWKVIFLSFRLFDQAWYFPRHLDMSPKWLMGCLRGLETPLYSSFLVLILRQQSIEVEFCFENLYLWFVLPILIWWVFLLVWPGFRVSIIHCRFAPVTSYLTLARKCIAFSGLNRLQKHHQSSARHSWLYNEIAGYQRSKFFGDSRGIGSATQLFLTLKCLSPPSWWTRYLPYLRFAFLMMDATNLSGYIRLDIFTQARSRPDKWSWSCLVARYRRVSYGG